MHGSQIMPPHYSEIRSLTMKGGPQLHRPLWDTQHKKSGPSPVPPVGGGGAGREGWAGRVGRVVSHYHDPYDVGSEGGQWEGIACDMSKGKGAM